MDIYGDDSKFKFDDMRNRSFRLSNDSVMKRLQVTKDKFNIAMENNCYDEMNDIFIENLNIEFDVAYDDIRNGLFLPVEDIIEFLEHYISLNDMKKVKYLSYMLNNYYKSEFFNDKMFDAINIEAYEDAALFRDLSNIKITPSEKE